MATTTTSTASARNKGKLTSKDLIALGVFSLLFIIVSMLVIGISSISVITYMAGPAIAAIPAGVIWSYVHVRIPRFGTSLIMGSIFAIIVFFMGSGWPVAVGLIGGAALSESIRKLMGYGRFSGIMVGYGLFEACFAAGTFIPMFAIADYYETLMASNSIDPAFAQTLLAVVTPTSVLGISGAAFVGAVAGALLGRALLKKHFVRAGIA